MQAYKLQGKIDHNGQLQLTDLPSLPAGDVEIILLHRDRTKPPAVSPIERPKTAVKVFQDLFQQTVSAPIDFDPDQMRWEALKEKHDL
ncbi:MAG: hypothetical protein RLZZ511_170 [Cyanobacteriota bacterium]|jgi:hypothetical protein